MEAVYALILAAAAIVGVIIGLIIPRKKKVSCKVPSNVSEDNSKYEEIINELNEKIRLLTSKCDELKSSVQKKNEEILSLQGQIVSGADVDSTTFLETIKSDADAQIKKLKRELEDLQDELEDTDSDLKKAKRKIQEKDEEKGILELNLSKANRTISDITSKLQSAKEELDDANSHLQLTESSLDFVEEILTAAPIQSESLSVKWKKISDISNFIFFDFQELVKQHFKVDDQSEYIFGNGLFQWEAIKKKSWIEGKKTIAFIGEFSAGKTSIVNRILSQDDTSAPVFPVSTKATTAIPTYIAGGDFTTFQFVSPDGTLKGISEGTFKRVSKDILGQIEGVSKLISYFVMTYNNPHLSGMSILDTPGFSSGDEEDAIRTIDVINECDALFWVFDVNAGTVNRSSLEVIKNNMSRPLYVIINKVDTKSKEDVESVEQLIKSTFTEEGIDVKEFIRFSKQASLDSLMNVIKSVENDNSAGEYISLVTGEYIATLIKTCENDSKMAHKELTSSERNCYNKKDKIVKLCEKIQNDSLNAKGIPHFEEYLFRKDRYEMTINEAETLKNILDRVANSEIKELSRLISEYGELMQENQKAWTESKSKDFTLRQFIECREKLNKLINELNN